MREFGGIDELDIAVVIGSRGLHALADQQDLGTRRVDRRDEGDGSSVPQSDSRGDGMLRLELRGRGRIRRRHRQFVDTMLQRQFSGNEHHASDRYAGDLIQTAAP